VAARAKTAEPRNVSQLFSDAD